jgi:hypothetical protein
MAPGLWRCASRPGCPFREKCPTAGRECEEHAEGSTSSETIAGSTASGRLCQIVCQRSCSVGHVSDTLGEDCVPLSTVSELRGARSPADTSLRRTVGSHREPRPFPGSQNTRLKTFAG